MYSIKLLNLLVGINFWIILLVFSSHVTSEEDDSDHLCLTFERKTTNVSKIVPETMNQTITSICAQNKTYSLCQKFVNATRLKTVWVQETSVMPVKMCCVGYEKVDGVCKPICTVPCENAHCVGPDKCKCNDGFIRDKKVAHKCNAVCNGCEDGLCLFPNLCDCDDGYRWEASELKCIPICTPNCTNGKCIAPNNCSCNDNYYFNEKLHACTSDCQKGYRFVANSVDVCEPICEPDCQNAKCVAPNECECNDPNYEKSITSNATHVCCPICASAEDCKNGKCALEGICNCFEQLGLQEEEQDHILPNEPLATKIPNNNQSIFNWHSLCISTIIVLVIIVLTSIIVWLYRNRKTSYYIKDDPNHVVQYAADW